LIFDFNFRFFLINFIISNQFSEISFTNKFRYFPKRYFSFYNYFFTLSREQNSAIRSNIENIYWLRVSIEDRTGRRRRGRRFIVVIAGAGGGRAGNP
jgi:hypothetical protein